MTSARQRVAAKHLPTVIGAKNIGFTYIKDMLVAAAHSRRLEVPLGVLGPVDIAFARAALAVTQLAPALTHEAHKDALIAEYLVMAHLVATLWQMPPTGDRQPLPPAQLWQAAERLSLELRASLVQSTDLHFLPLLNVLKQAWERGDTNGWVDGGLSAADMPALVSAVCACSLPEGAASTSDVAMLLRTLLLRASLAAVRAGRASADDLTSLLDWNDPLDSIFVHTLVEAGGALGINAALRAMVPPAAAECTMTVVQAEGFVLLVCDLLSAPSSSIAPTMVEVEVMQAATAAISLMLRREAPRAESYAQTLVSLLCSTGRGAIALQVLVSALESATSAAAQQTLVFHFARDSQSACEPVPSSNSSSSSSTSGTSTRTRTFELASQLLNHLFQKAHADSRTHALDAFCAALMLGQQLALLLPRITAEEAARGGGTSLLGPLLCEILLPLLEPASAAAVQLMQVEEQPQERPWWNFFQTMQPSAPPLASEPLFPDATALAMYLTRCPPSSCFALLRAAAGGPQHAPAALSLQQQVCRVRGFSEPSALAARLLTSAVEHSPAQALLQLQHRHACGDVEAVARLMPPHALAALLQACLGAGKLPDATGLLLLLPSQQRAAHLVLQAIGIAATPAEAFAAAEAACPLAARCACECSDPDLLLLALQTAGHHGTAAGTEAALLTPVSRLATALTLLFSTIQASPAASSTRAVPGCTATAPVVSASAAAGLALLRQHCGEGMQPDGALLRLLPLPAVEGLCLALLEAMHLDAAAYVAAQISDGPARRRQLRCLCDKLLADDMPDATLSSAALASLSVFASVAAGRVGQGSGSDTGLLLAALAATRRLGTLPSAIAALSSTDAAGCAATLVLGGRSDDAIRWVDLLAQHLTPADATAASCAAGRAVQSLPPALVTGDGWRLMVATHASIPGGDASLPWDAAAAALVLGTAAVPGGAKRLRHVLTEGVRAWSSLQPDAPGMAALLAHFQRFFQRLDGPAADLPAEVVAELRPQLAAMLGALVGYHRGGGQTWASLLPGPALRLALELCVSEGWADAACGLWQQRDRRLALRLGDALVLSMLVLAATAGDAPMGAELIEGQLPRTFKKGSRTDHPDAYAAYTGLLAMSGNTKAAWQELQALPNAAPGTSTEQMKQAAAEALLAAWCPEGGDTKEAQQAWQLYNHMLDNARPANQRSSDRTSLAARLPAARVRTVATMVSLCRRNLDVRRLADARLVLDLAVFLAPPGGSSAAGGPVPDADDLRVVALDVVLWYSQRGQRGAVAAALFVLPGFVSRDDAASVSALELDTDNVIIMCQRALNNTAADHGLTGRAEPAAGATQERRLAMQCGQAVVRGTAEAWLEGGGGGGERGRSKGGGSKAQGAQSSLNQLLERDLKAAFELTV